MRVNAAIKKKTTIATTRSEEEEEDESEMESQRCERRKY